MKKELAQSGLPVLRKIQKTAQNHQKMTKVDFRPNTPLLSAVYVYSVWILMDPGLLAMIRKEWEGIWNPTMFVDPAYSSLLNNKDTYLLEYLYLTW